jgi:hypothetical protein
MPSSSGQRGTADVSGRGLAGALALVLVSLAGTALSGFLLDDTLHLARAAAAWPTGVDGAIVPAELGLHTPSGPVPVAFTYLRPVTALSLLVDYRLFGLRPFGFHVVNLLLHLLNVLQARALGRRLGLEPRPALAAALAWGVSLPAGLAAGWISGRSELLAAAFVLGALQLVLRGRDRGDRRPLAAAAIMLVLGGLAKESALVAPVLVLLFVATVGPRGPAAANSPTPVARRDLLLALGAALLTGLAVRALAGGAPQLPPPYFQPPATPAAAGDLLLRLLTCLAGALTGLPVVPFAPQAALRAHAWAIAPLALSVVAGLWFLPRGVARRPRALCLAWFAFALAPALLVMSFSLYLYLPLLGLCWLLGLAAQSSAPRAERSARAARHWLRGLTIIGLALGLALSGALVSVGRHARAAEAVLAAALAATPARDVVLVDAPFWAYALPVTAGLREPSQDCRAHLVTFSPSLRSAAPSALAWTGDDAFALEQPGRSYFTSPLERFFLFGNDPCRDGRVGAAATIGCAARTGAAGATDRLTVSLRRSADGRLPLVLQFAGWDLRVVPAPVATRGAAPASE